MSRPKKQTVDYFPHYCNHGKTMFVLEQKYGNDGYAFWFKLLEIIGNTEGHCPCFSNGIDWQFLEAKARLDKNTCSEIMDLLATIEAIDKDLWLEEKRVWVQNFVDNIRDAYRNRVVDIPDKPDILRKKPHDNKDKLRKKSTDETKLNEIKEKDIYISLLDFWNSKKIIVHKVLSDTMKKKINAKLQEGYTLKDFKTAIGYYAQIIRDDKYWLEYHWTLDEFLQRGFLKCLSEEVINANYLIKEDKWKQKR